MCEYLFLAVNDSFSKTAFIFSMNWTWLGLGGYFEVSLRFEKDAGSLADLFSWPQTSRWAPMVTRIYQHSISLGM